MCIRDSLKTGNVALGHGDSRGVKSDFTSSSYQQAQNSLRQLDAVLPRGTEIRIQEAGDHHRSLHYAIVISGNMLSDEIASVVFFKDRANQSNATNTNYDVYVIDGDLLQQMLTKHRGNVHSGWESQVGRGKYCTTQKQIVDTVIKGYRENTPEIQQIEDPDYWD